MSPSDNYQRMSSSLLPSRSDEMRRHAKLDLLSLLMNERSASSSSCKMALILSSARKIEMAVQVILSPLATSRCAAKSPHDPTHTPSGIYCQVVTLEPPGHPSRQGNEISVTGHYENSPGTRGQSSEGFRAVTECLFHRNDDNNLRQHSPYFTAL
jgi:hypothetical protein